MSSPGASPWRDRAAILAGLGGITLLAWAHLLIMARDMAGSSMAGMADMVMIRAWSARDFALMFLMWAIMMVGMMAPTAAPMTLIYAAVARKAARQDSPLPPTGIFVAGYIATWTFFSAFATVAQWALDRAALLSPMMVANSSALGAALLIAAGVWQLTAFKNACLEHCRAPALFMAGHWRDGYGGAFRMGLDHGAYCLGCCWVLMGLLFVGGVMNLVWIAAIALFVLLERIVPYGAGGGRLAGVLMILAGVLMLAGFRFG